VFDAESGEMESVVEIANNLSINSKAPQLMLI
jgi:hypothetical protein